MTDVPEMVERVWNEIRKIVVCKIRGGTRWGVGRFNGGEFAVEADFPYQAQAEAACSQIQARAAIEATRQPFKDWLVRNGATWHNPPNDKFIDAMIDAALGKESGGGHD